MNSYENISNELKLFFSKHPVFRVLLPIDSVLIFGALGFMLINNLFPRLGLGTGFFGNLIASLVYWVFILGLLLAYANLNEKFLYSGLFGYAGMELILLFIIIVRSKYFSSSYLVPIIIFGGLGYLVFKRTSAVHTQQTYQGSGGYGPVQQPPVQQQASTSVPVQSSGQQQATATAPVQSPGQQQAPESAPVQPDSQHQASASAPAQPEEQPHSGLSAFSSDQRCKACGAEMRPESMFCTNCGTKRE